MEKRWGRAGGKARIVQGLPSGVELMHREWEAQATQVRSDGYLADGRRRLDTWDRETEGEASLGKVTTPRFLGKIQGCLQGKDMGEEEIWGGY